MVAATDRLRYCRRAAHHRPAPTTVPTVQHIRLRLYCICTVLYCMYYSICICIPTRERCARVRVVMMLSYNESVVANKRAVTSRTSKPKLLVAYCLIVFTSSVQLQHRTQCQSSKQYFIRPFDRLLVSYCTLLCGQHHTHVR
jgi:hypothetical protein